MQRKTTSFIMILFLFIGSTLVMAQGHSDPFDISVAIGHQEICQTEFDPVNNQYLVVWEDTRLGGDSDVYGQFVAGDGTLIGENFAICTTPGDQWWPRMAFDAANERFLIVFEDNRNGIDQGDIRGVFIDSNGNFVDAPSSDEDHTFGICTEGHDIYTCSVAFNYIDNVYLAVWGDNRVLTEAIGEQWGVDIYGQIISADGSLILPNDPTVNFPVDSASWYNASVPDVTYNAVTNEFFVAYGTEMGYVLGQRVNSNAELINPDGSVSGLAKTSTVLPAMFVSKWFNNGPDCFQARTAARFGLQLPLLNKAVMMDTTEVLVVWKGQRDDTPEGFFNDVYGQRIMFVLEEGLYAAQYIDLNGDVTENQSNFPISLQPGWAWPPEIAYSDVDDEFLVGWGDPRDEATNDDDFYMQRLWINEENDMIFFADDRVNTVTNTENIPLATSSIEERSLAGIAYNSQNNSFLVVYQTGARSDENGVNIVGNIVYGTPVEPDAVSKIETLPGSYKLGQNYPNPFNPSTRIEFSVKEAGRVTLSVFDAQGRKAAKLLDQHFDPGTFQISFDASHFPSGVYFYKLQVNDFTDVKKMILMR